MGKKHKGKKHPAGGNLATGGQTGSLHQEKTSLGGQYNQGVTSRDETEKTKIEKRANLSGRSSGPQAMRPGDQRDDEANAQDHPFPEIANERSGKERES